MHYFFCLTRCTGSNIHQGFLQAKMTTEVLNSVGNVKCNDHRNWLKLLHQRVLYKQRQKSVKATAWPSFFFWTAEKSTSSIAARISVEHKTRGSYKDDCTSDRVDVFFVERGRKKPYKGFEFFVKDMTGNLVQHTFSYLTDILLPMSHWTISNYSLLNTRLIEAEYSRPG